MYLHHQWSDEAHTLQFCSTNEYYKTTEYEPQTPVFENGDDNLKFHLDSSVGYSQNIIASDEITLKTGGSYPLLVNCSPM